MLQPYVLTLSVSLLCIDTVSSYICPSVRLRDHLITTPLTIHYPAKVLIVLNDRLYQYISRSDIAIDRIGKRDRIGNVKAHIKFNQDSTLSKLSLSNGHKKQTIPFHSKEAA